MLPTQGPWIDSVHFTNTRLLLDIGRSNRDAALGVCINRNITGDELAEVAANANLTAANIENAANGAHLMHGRTARDQLTLLKATAARSGPAAKTLVTAASLETLLVLHHELDGARFKGAAALREALREMDNIHLIRRSHEPAYMEFVEAVCSRQDLAHIAVLAAGSTRDKDRLMGLAPMLAEHANPVIPLTNIVANCLLACTIHYPEVVAHWAEHGGRAGAQLASYDHRQDGQMLLDLAAEHPEYGLEHALSTNPAIPFEYRARKAGEEFADLLMSGDAAAVSRIATLSDRGQQMLKSKTMWGTGFAAGEFTDIPSMVNALTNHRSGREFTLLLRFILATSASTTTEDRAKLLNHMVSNVDTLVPSSLFADAARLLPGLRGLTYYSAQLGREVLDASTEVEAENYESEPTTHVFLTGSCRTIGRLPQWHGADLVSARCTSVSHLEALWDHISKMGYRDRANVTLASAITQTRPRADTEVVANKMQQLIPSALGAF